MKTPLRITIPHNEFDYQTLMSALGDYKYPRDRVTTLLRRGTIIRVKKGIYVFGPHECRGPHSNEILANLIYGPSYISLEYALSHHGLIPERVETLTSVTTGRSRAFNTPVGSFSYRNIPLAAFATGVEQVAIGRDRYCLLAVPEKALADKTRLDKIALRSQKEVRQYLFENLRLEPDALLTLRAHFLHDYAQRYRSRKIELLGRVVDRWQKSGGGSDHA